MSENNTAVVSRNYQNNFVPNGTKLNECQFWSKVGSCRHGNKCAKIHKRPTRSKTVVFWKIFNNPIRTYYGRGPLSKQADIIDDSNDGFVTIKVDIDENYLKSETDRLYQDLFVELSLNFGEIDGILICGNFNPHIGGNVLVKFKDEKTAFRCYQSCNDRWYNGKPMFCDFSPVQYFEDAICKGFSSHGRCERGDKCNLIHPRRPNPELHRTLISSQRDYYKDKD
ncbi:hypothetical protein DAPK24_041760 [Pichia kluyveri]|uniref:C3H1-type domain-containing protein n=1 Tax=Pichia kluyveri TaxID=36015 RepID=A0AAV5R9V7_PICKL|nr:hypothetical protein DAPK24_041760 [Pichia kluyveri]